MVQNDQAHELVRLLDGLIWKIDQDPASVVDAAVVIRAATAVLHLLGEDLEGATAVVEVRRRLRQVDGLTALANQLDRVINGEKVHGFDVARIIAELRAIPRQGVGGSITIGGGSADGAAIITGGTVGSIRTRSIKIGRLNLGLGQAIGLGIVAVVILAGGTTAAVVATRPADEGPADVVIKVGAGGMSEIERETYICQAQRESEAQLRRELVSPPPAAPKIDPADVKQIVTVVRQTKTYAEVRVQTGYRQPGEQEISMDDAGIILVDVVFEDGRWKVCGLRSP